MSQTALQILFFLDLVVLLTVVFSHIVKKNFTLLNIFLVQSLAVSGVLFTLAWQANSIELFVGAALTFLLKVVVVPAYFSRLIKQHQVKFTGTSYLNTPLTLVAVAILTALAYSKLLVPLYLISQAPRSFVQLPMAAMLVAFFLIINRKGALSQIVGILSLENAILSFAALIFWFG
ncbi:hypothetical protein HY224_02265 [Candidatus Uhrbacteria bacterium]|nr:hypothetical protein [Candidatus Uhrbacteria bacterium]